MADPGSPSGGGGIDDETRRMKREAAIRLKEAEHEKLRAEEGERKRLNCFYDFNFTFTFFNGNLIDAQVQRTVKTKPPEMER